MCQKKMLVVYSNRSSAASFVMKGVEDSSIDAKCLCVKKNYISKVFFKFFFWLRLYRIAGCFRMEKRFRQCLKSDVFHEVIFFDCAPLKEYFVLNSYLKKNKKKFIYFWNPIKYRESDERRSLGIIEKIKKDGFLLKTFEKGDSERFQMVYLKSPNRKACFEQYKEKVDFYFAGLPKGRQSDLEMLRSNLLKKGFSAKFIFVHKESDYISQEENRVNSENCKCIVDWVSEDYGQRNLSLRSTDALLLGKKIITNCKAILDADFYNPSNVFLVKDLNLEGIESFMEKPYERISKDIVDSYEINNWLKMNF